MSEKYFLAFDLETGGLDPAKTDLLTGFFAILDEDYKILDELSLALKPDGRLPVVEARAMATNGIDIQKHLEDPNTVTYAEGAKKLTAFVKKYLKKHSKYSNIIAFGFNIASFDVPWAHHHLIDKTTWESMIHYKCLDVSHDVDVLKRHGWLPPFCGTLTSMVEFFAVPKLEAHVARNDILMTLQVFLKIKELMDSKKENRSSQDLISLLESE